MKHAPKDQSQRTTGLPNLDSNTLGDLFLELDMICRVFLVFGSSSSLRCDTPREFKWENLRIEWVLKVYNNSLDTLSLPFAGSITALTVVDGALSSSSSSIG